MFTQEPDNHWAAGLAETKSVSLLCAEGRSERLALFDFLRDLSNVFHVPPRHWQPVAHRFPPPPGASPVSPDTYICGFDQSQEWFVCAQGLRGMTVNMQESLSLASGAGIRHGGQGWFSSSFLSSASSCSRAGTGCLRVPGSQGASQLSATPPARSRAPWSQAVAMHLGARGIVTEPGQQLEGAAKEALFSVVNSSKEVSLSERIPRARLLERDGERAPPL